VFAQSQLERYPRSRNGENEVANPIIFKQQIAELAF